MTLTEQFRTDITRTERDSNDTMIRNYTRIYDTDHSWLEVPVKDVGISGVNITPYSPIKGGKMYLEEDCDLYTFYDAMKQIGYTINITKLNVGDFDQYLANK